MKKFLIILIILIISSTSYGYSSEFKFMIDVMQIEEQNEDNYYINEEIYNAYNQLVYGSPNDISKNQRWKNVKDGKWMRNGVRGEYWVLGFNYSGGEVHNHSFPVDIEPPTPPTSWRYVTLDDAKASWNDTKKYLHEEQKEYMRQIKLTRNNTTYDLTALDIGLDKARVENYATWKTNGNIYTERYDIENKKWAANFIVPPMAANAELISKIYLPKGKDYLFPENDDSIEIQIMFGADAINLSDYAKAEHVKIIKSQIIINDKVVDSIENTKKINISKNGNIIINKNDYNGKSSVQIEIMCKSYLITEYTVDGALTDVKTAIINVKFEGVQEDTTTDIEVRDSNKTINKKLPPPKITSLMLKKETINGNINLSINKKTNTKFICAGQVLVLEVSTASSVEYITFAIEGNSSISTLDELTKKFEWDEPKSRNVKTRYNNLNSLKKQYEMPVTIYPKSSNEGNSKFEYYYVVPYMTKQTLHSWSTLRSINKDALNIEETKLFQRIRSPYIIKVKAYSKNGVVTESIILDVFERFDTLYNRDLRPYIL